jgi:cytoskeletal protein CcmA (bactofilin family)
MARKTHDDALGVTGAETVIGAGVTVEGNLASDADIIIDGRLTGDIKTEGDLVIGVNASIQANVQATNVTVAGSLTGNITAQGEATIRETGHVKGDIKASGLAIISGGVFIGRSLMKPPPRLNAEPDNADEPTPESKDKS